MHIASCAISIMILLASSASAGLMSSGSIGVTPQWAGGGEAGGPYYCSAGASGGYAGCAVSGPGRVYTNPPDFAEFTVFGWTEAISEYGHVYAYTEFFAESWGTAFATGTAEAMYSDDIAVVGGTGAGLIQFVFSGTRARISDNRGSLKFAYQAYPEETEDFGFGNTPGSRPPTPVPFVFTTGLYPFTYGVPFQYSFTATARVQGASDGYGAGMFDAYLTEIRLFDLDGNPIQGQIVPEPSTFLLALPVLALAGLARLRRRQ